MNRLMIVPILLWVGLIAHAPPASPAPSPFSTPGSGVEISSADNNAEADLVHIAETHNAAEFEAFRKKTMIRNGIFQGYHNNGELQFTSVVRKSRLQGIWKSWYTDGSICDSGKFVKDIPDGEWKGWYPDGRLRYVWHFSATKYFSLKNEMSDQPKQRFFKIAQLPLNEGIQYYKTDYIFGQITSSPSVLFRTKTLEHSSFDPGNIKKKVDRNTETDSYVPPFPECLFHGTFTSYYPDGRKREEGKYLNGMRNGLWEEYSRDGKKSRGVYQYGRKTGEWRTYNGKGKLQSMQRYNKTGVETDSHDFQAGE